MSSQPDEPGQPGQPDQPLVIPTGPGEPPPVPDTPLAQAVVEVEQHVGEGGWDQPAQLFALVETADLLRREPGLAVLLGLEGEPAPGSLTPVQQEQLPHDRPLEQVLETLVWPDDVVGCAAVVERTVLPPEADGDVPSDPDEAARFAAAHPLRQELRLVAGTTRAGDSFCAMRFRSHDDPSLVVTGPDLVPGLLQLLQATLDPDPEAGDAP